MHLLIFMIGNLLGVFVGFTLASIIVLVNWERKLPPLLLPESCDQKQPCDEPSQGESQSFSLHQITL